MIKFRLWLVSGAKPRTPKGSSRTAQGASPGFKVQIAESPERAAQGVRSQLQINARHKAPLWYRDQLHRPFGASFAPETSYSERPSYRPVSHGRDGHATKPIVSCFTTETRGYSPCIVVYSVSQW